MRATLVLAAVLVAACGVPRPSARPCDADTCPEGCCDADGVCRNGGALTACGAGGGTCQACGAADTCTAGVCVPPPDAGSCPPSTDVPTGRSDFAGVVDEAQRRVVFYGGDPGVAQNCTPNPQFSGETWAFDLKCKTWQKLAVHSPRARHVGVLDERRQRLVVFGGRYRAAASGPYTVYNEVHTFDLKTNEWKQAAAQGALPVGLANAAAAYDAADDQLLVYGGNSSTSGATFVPQGDVWALALSSFTWTKLVPTQGPVPPARLFHAAALDAKRHRLVVYGGGGANAFQGPFYGDVWAFDLATQRWTALSPSGPAPANRIRGVFVADPERDRLILFGGHDDQAQGERNDLWALDLAQNAWQALRTGDTLKNTNTSACNFPPDFTTTDFTSPERREAHIFPYSASAKKAFMVGGRSDCGTLMDVWALDVATAAWEQLKPAFAGVSCERSGKQGCTTLCF